MLAWLFLLFVVVPLVELALLLKLADWSGDWRVTLLVVVATGLLGTLLARSQGFRTYRRIQGELSAGRMPTDSLLDAVMIFVAGALLVTPGILTDLFGMSLLIPSCRRLYRRQMASWIKSHFTVHSLHERQFAAVRLPGDRLVRGGRGERRGSRAAGAGRFAIPSKWWGGLIDGLLASGML